MISTRRLAREWALKILYQADVAKMSVEESQQVALERLRMEFVQRASRTATGSALEERLSEAVTAHLADLLPHYSPAVEAGLRAAFTQIAEAGDYWLTLDADVTFSRQSFQALWEPPRRQEVVLLPARVGALPRAVIDHQDLGDSDRARLVAFLSWAREGLPRAALLAFSQEVKALRPDGAKLRETHEMVVDRWTLFPREMAARWSPAVRAVEKHVYDWMRVAAFTLRLVTGVEAHREELDRSLQELEIGWALDRQVSVDRNILRMAAFELGYLESVPASATINEAVELAKKYSTAESGKFVNGILGAIVARQDAPHGQEAAGDGAQEPVDPDGSVEEIANEEELTPV